MSLVIHVVQAPVLLKAKPSGGDDKPFMILGGHQNMGYKSLSQKEEGTVICMGFRHLLELLLGSSHPKPQNP